MERSDERGDSPAAGHDRGGWLDFVWCIVGEVFSDHITMTAAGLAFYGLLGLVPVLAAVSALYGLVADPSDVRRLVEGLNGLLPGKVTGLLSAFLRDTRYSFGLGIGFVISLAFVLWTAQWAASGLITALNIVYDETERRSFLQRQLVALAIALGGIAFLLFAIVLVAVLPAAVSILSEDIAHPVLWLARWPLLALLFMASLSVLYNVAPSRARRRWRWLSWGAVTATVLWLGASVAFSAYASRLGSFGRYYGSMGTVAVLLLWFYLGGLIVLLGAEVDAALAERRDGAPPSEIKGALAERERNVARQRRDGRGT